MATNFQNCPECGRRLQILEPSRPGKRVICPQCGQHFFPAGQTWLESHAPKPTTPFRRMVKPLWAMATLFLIVGIAGGFFLCSRPASATSSPPAQVTATAKDPIEQPDPHSEFRRLLVAGNAALARQQFRDAIASYQTARKLFPEDVDAAKGLAAVRAGLADAQIAQNVPPPNPYLDQVAKNVHDAQKAKVDQQANSSAFMRLMNQASIAMLDGSYDDARNFYIQALEIATSPAAGPVMVNSAGEPWAPPFAQVSSSDSARDSQAALGGLRQANYLLAMANGDSAMRARNYSDAVLDFQAALRQLPNDRDATWALQQARAFSG